MDYNKKTSSEGDDSDILMEARRAFEEARDAEDHNRLTYIEDTRFARLGEQWPDAIRQQRERDGRPCLTINRMPTFIRQVVNDARMNKPAIKVKAADGSGDPMVADIIGGLVRNIEHVSNASDAYDTAVENSVTGGYGYWRVSLGYAFDDAFDLDIMIERIVNPLSVYGDPNSTSADGSDWNVAFVTERLHKDTFKRKYGDKSTVDFDADEWRDLGDDWMNEEGVLIAEYWTREEEERRIVRLSDGRVIDQETLENDESIIAALSVGMVQITGERTVTAHKVTQRIISGAEVLETNEWPGSYIPIVPVYGDEFFCEGKRYLRSLIHPAKDAQRMANFWRTASTELVALAPRVPFIGPAGAFAGDDGWNAVNTANLPYLEYEGQVPPQRQPLDSGVAAGALQEAMNATDDMKAIMGLYDASLGARSNETSGRAILARQREGDISTFHFIDNLSRAIRHTGRIIVDLIPRVYTGPRIVRVLGEDGKEQSVPVNQAVQMPDPRGQAIERIFDLSLGKYDVAVESGPSFTTRRDEMAMALQELIRAFPPSAPVLGAEMVKAMDFPNAEKIAEKLAKLDPTNENKLPPEVQQQIQQGMQRIQQLEAENAKLKADMQIDQAKVKVDAFEAETDRMEAMANMQETQMRAAAMMAPRFTPMI